MKIGKVFPATYFKLRKINLNYLKKKVVDRLFLFSAKLYFPWESRFEHIF